MKTAYCPICNQNVLTKREEINIPLIILLCIFTGGFGAIIYLIIYYNKEENRCTVCGSITTNFPIQPRGQDDKPIEILQEKEQNNQIKFCPNCGSQVTNKDNTEQPNFCPYCGVKLNIHLNYELNCTICHQKIEHYDHKINCTYCGSPYHYRCVSKWLSEYNSCPLCQNQFLTPIIKK